MFCIKICFLEPGPVGEDRLRMEPEPIFFPWSQSRKKISGAEEKWLGSTTLIKSTLWDMMEKWRQIRRIEDVLEEEGIEWEKWGQIGRSGDQLGEVGINLEKWGSIGRSGDQLVDRGTEEIENWEDTERNTEREIQTKKC